MVLIDELNFNIAAATLQPATTTEKNLLPIWIPIIIGLGFVFVLGVFGILWYYVKKNEKPNQREQIDVENIFVKEQKPKVSKEKKRLISVNVFFPKKGLKRIRNKNWNGMYYILNF